MTTEAILKQPEGTSKEEFAQVAKTITNANKNTKGSREALVKLLDQHPDLAMLGGDLAHKAENAILENATGGNVLVTETTRRQLQTCARSCKGPEMGS